jgi:hypothetical protein
MPRKCDADLIPRRCALVSDVNLGSTPWKTAAPDGAARSITASLSI